MPRLLQHRRRDGYRPVMPPAEPLKISLPQTFARLTAPLFAPDEELPDLVGLDGQWLRVSGGSLPLPVTVRIDQSDDGRFIVTGLLLGFRERREITWETLRRLNLASLLESIFEGYDPDNPAAIYANEQDIFGRGIVHLALWHARKGMQGAAPPNSRRRTAAPDLRLFATTYLRHLAVKPHTAMTATARELHVSRATAIRRAAECRKVGLLPAKGTRS